MDKRKTPLLCLPFLLLSSCTIGYEDLESQSEPALSSALIQSEPVSSSMMSQSEQAPSSVTSQSETAHFSSRSESEPLSSLATSQSQEDEKREVDATLWNEAFASLSNFTMTLIVRKDVYTSKFASKELVSSSYTLEDGSSVSNSISSKENGKWYSYGYNEQDQAWRRCPTNDQDAFIEFFFQLVSFGGDEYFKQFSYDEIENEYYCPALVKTIDTGDDEACLKQSDIHVAFLNGELERVSLATQIDPTVEETVSFLLVDIGETEVFLPEEYE